MKAITGAPRPALLQCHVSDHAGEGDRAIAFGLGPSCSGHRLRDGALDRELRAVRQTRFPGSRWIV
jgi:hypothetical protein